MKKYRCPYCGDECLTYFLRNFTSGFRSEYYQEKGGSRCPYCHNYFMPYIRNKAIRIASVVLTVAVLGVFFVLALFVDYRYYLLFAISVGLLTLLDSVVYCLSASITQYDQKEHKNIMPAKDKDREIVLDTPCAKIRYLDIYGVRFLKKTNNVRFHEAFKNDLVPVVFLREKRTKNQTVHFMKTEFIPEGMLCDNAELEIVDNGKIIAKGRLSVKKVT